MGEEGLDGGHEDRRDACVYKEFLFGTGPLGIAEAGTLIGVFDGGINTGEELLVEIHADWRSLDGSADLDPTGAGFGVNCGGVDIFESVADAAQATTNYAHERTRHTGEGDKEG